MRQRVSDFGSICVGIGLGQPALEGESLSVGCLRLMHTLVITEVIRQIVQGLGKKGINIGMGLSKCANHRECLPVGILCLLQPSRPVIENP